MKNFQDQNRGMTHTQTDYKISKTICLRFLKNFDYNLVSQGNITPRLTANDLRILTNLVSQGN